MSERKPGWYWVKDGEETGGQWVPWEWIGESDLLPARWYHSLSFSEVGPRIHTPDEPWQYVPVEAIKYAAEVLRSNSGPLTCEAAAKMAE